MIDSRVCGCADRDILQYVLCCHESSVNLYGMTRYMRYRIPMMCMVSGVDCNSVFICILAISLSACAC